MIKGKIFLIIFASALLIALPIKILADTGFISWDMSGNTGNAKLTIDGDVSEIVVHIRGERGTSKITAYAYLEYYDEADDRWIADTSWSEQTESAQLGFTRRTAVASGRTYRIRVLYYVYDKNGRSNNYTIYGNKVKSAAANGTQGTDAAQNMDGTQGSTDAAQDVDGTQGTYAAQNVDGTQGSTDAAQDVDGTQGTDAAQNTDGTEGTNAAQGTDGTNDAQGTNDGTQAGTQQEGNTTSETQPTTEEATQEEPSQEEPSQKKTNSIISGVLPPEEKVYCYYGEVEIPDVPAKIKTNEGKMGYMYYYEGDADFYDACIDGVIFETHTFGDYTLRLVGDGVRTDKEDFPGWIYAKKLRVEVEKNGEYIGHAGFSCFVAEISALPEESRVCEEYIGNYIDFYELECPVIVLRYIFGYEEERNLKKMVSFSYIMHDEVQGGHFIECCEGTCVWMSDIDAPDYDGYYSCILPEAGTSLAAIFEADKFVIIDERTLMDEEAGLRYTFDFSEPRPPFYLPISTRYYVERIQPEIN